MNAIDCGGQRSNVSHYSRDIPGKFSDLQVGLKGIQFIIVDLFHQIGSGFFKPKYIAGFPWTEVQWCILEQNGFSLAGTLDGSKNTHESIDPFPSSTKLDANLGTNFLVIFGWNAPKGPKSGAGTIMEMDPHCPKIPPPQCPSRGEHTVYKQHCSLFWLCAHTVLPLASRCTFVIHLQQPVTETSAASATS